VWNWRGFASIYPVGNAYRFLISPITGTARVFEKAHRPTYVHMHMLTYNVIHRNKSIHA